MVFSEDLVSRSKTHSFLQSVVQGDAHIPLRLREPGLQTLVFCPDLYSLKTITRHMKKVELFLGLVSPGPAGHFPLSAALAFAQLCPAQALQHSVSQKCAHYLDARDSQKVTGVAAQAKQQWLPPAVSLALCWGYAHHFPLCNGNSAADTAGSLPLGPRS